jgi:predicted ester cyclase
VLTVADDTIVTENEWSGTHLGKFLGYPPTGKRVNVRALARHAIQRLPSRDMPRPGTIIWMCE